MVLNIGKLRIEADRWNAKFLTNREVAIYTGFIKRTEDITAGGYIWEFRISIYLWTLRFDFSIAYF
jgi:hypothetical protein